MTSALLASAAVAVATTLLVEYAAKPRLEARKARILQRQQRKEGLRTAVQLIDLDVGILANLLDARDRASQTSWDALTAEIQLTRARIETNTRGLRSDLRLAFAGPTLDSSSDTVAAIQVGELCDLLLGTAARESALRPEEELALHDGAAHAFAVLTSQTWSARGRRSRRAARRWLSAVHGNTL